MVMKDNFKAIILKVPYKNMASADQVEILGKSMIEWVKLSLSDAPFSIIDYTETLSLPELVKGSLNRDKEFTVVLFSDTPLLTKKTVLDAVAELEASKSNVIKMTRGYVFRTEYLATVEKIYATDVHYFDEEDFITADDYKQVAYISDVLRLRILNYHMERGVHIQDIATTFISTDTVIEPGVNIAPHNIIKGKCIIKAGAKILNGNTLEDAIISQGAVINSSQIYKSYIGAKTTVGPNAYIRPNTLIGDGCRIGDFVEIKSSVIGSGSKVSHLTYIGDTEMGENCNVGCGVVFANYDGADKHKSKVGNNVFIGSNVTCIAPIVIGNGAFLAAGSTLDKSVESGALAVARSKQVCKPNWENNKYTKDN